jgi:hypothetical protein
MCGKKGVYEDPFNLLALFVIVLALIAISAIMSIKADNGGNPFPNA